MIYLNWHNMRMRSTFIEKSNIRLKSRKTYDNKEIMIGNVKFVIE